MSWLYTLNSPLFTESSIAPNLRVSMSTTFEYSVSGTVYLIPSPFTKKDSNFYIFYIGCYNFPFGFNTCEIFNYFKMKQICYIFLLNVNRMKYEELLWHHKPVQYEIFIFYDVNELSCCSLSKQIFVVAGFKLSGKSHIICSNTNYIIRFWHDL